VTKVGSDHKSKSHDIGSFQLLGDRMIYFRVRSYSGRGWVPIGLPSAELAALLGVLDEENTVPNTACQSKRHRGERHR